MSLSLATVRIAVTQASPILPRAEDGIGISRRQQDSAPAGSPRGAGFRNLGGMRSLATYSQNTESLAPLTFSQLDFFTTVWLSHIVSFATFGMSRVTSGSPNRLGELRHGLRSGVAAIGKLMSDIGRLCQIGRLYALPPEATAHPGTNELRRIVNVVVLLVISIALTGSAWAQAIDRCDDVLKQDLFNRSSSQSEQKQSAQDAQSAAFFSQDWNKAYDEYSKAYDDEKKQGTSGHLDGHYGVIGGAADFAHTYDRKLTGDEFKKDFTEAQKMYQGSSSSSSANESSLIGIYSSSVRDPNTIKAWETCMSTSREAGLFAYGHRDQGGSPFITVLWVPGDMVGFATSINVGFVVPQSGVEIEASEPEKEIGMGSGTSFAIRFKDSNDRKAKTEGFAVLVNGRVKKDGTVVRSFQANAVVPDDIRHAATYGIGHPIACTSVFQENKEYRIVMTAAQTMVESKLVIGGRVSDPSLRQPDAAYSATLVPSERLGLPAMPGHVSMKGEHLVLRFENPKEPPMTGQCNENQEVTGSTRRGTRWVIKPMLNRVRPQTLGTRP